MIVAVVSFGAGSTRLVLPVALIVAHSIPICCFGVFLSGWQACLASRSTILCTAGTACQSARAAEPLSMWPYCRLSVSLRRPRRVQPLLCQLSMVG